MSRSNRDIEFVPTDTDEIKTKLISDYESYTGKTLPLSSSEYIFICWAAGIISAERGYLNETAKQNLLSYAVGDTLDILAETMCGITRKPAEYAKCNITFNLSSYAGGISIPKMTRVSSDDGAVVFQTDSAVTSIYNEQSVTVECTCMTAGAVGNGYTAGTIRSCVDVFEGYVSCTNSTTSTFGTDTETDDELYDRCVASFSAYTTAGSTQSYVYRTKEVSSDIADVKVTSPGACLVTVYVLSKEGILAQGDTLLTAVSTALSADTVRPLTDSVTVTQPSSHPFTVNITYYINPDDLGAQSDIDTAVTAAVNEYVAWQTSKIGRDITPSMLVALVINAGAARVDVTSPTAATVGAYEAAQISNNTDISITYGGVINE